MECRIIIMFRIHIEFRMMRCSMRVTCSLENSILSCSHSHILSCQSAGVRACVYCAHKIWSTYISTEWIISKMWIRASLKYGNWQPEWSLYIHFTCVFAAKLTQSRLSHNERLCLPKQNDGSLLIEYINCLCCSFLAKYAQLHATQKGVPMK